MVFLKGIQQRQENSTTLSTLKVELLASNIISEKNSPKSKIKILINIIKYLIIFNIIFNAILYFPKCYNFRLNNQALSNLNEVTLKVSGTGENIKILGTKFNIAPSKILIDGLNYNYSDYHYIKIDISGSLITLQWDSDITTTIYMFDNCSQITEINMTKVDTSSVTEMNNMFMNCKSLEILDISNFNTTKVTSMFQMFYECHKLNPLNLQHFDTSNVRNFESMFKGCNSLTSLNLSNFNTKSATTMARMFYYCIKLENLDISNFNTTQVTSMYIMFSNCYKLVSLDLRSFDTSNVKVFQGMFYNSTLIKYININHFITKKATNMQGFIQNNPALTSLDLSNYDTINVVNMKNLFKGCTNLEYINIKNFEENENLDISNMFVNMPSNAVICLNKTKTPKISKLLNDSFPYIKISCEYNWRGYQNITENETDISPCLTDSDNYNNNISLYQLLINNLKINNDINGDANIEKIELISKPDEIILYNEDDDSQITLIDQNTKVKQNISLIKENIDYYIKVNIIFNYRYYFEQINILKFKLCFKYCNTCKLIGIKEDDQKCESCLNEYSYYHISHNSSECVPYDHFLDKENKIIENCTLYNSKFYIDIYNNNKRICIKKEYDCPQNFSYYDDINRQCKVICGNVSRTIRESNNCSTYPVSNEIIYTCIPSEESDGPACKEEYLCEQFTKDKTQCYDLPTSGIKKLCIPNPKEGNNQSCIEKYLCENITKDEDIKNCSNLTVSKNNIGTYICMNETDENKYNLCKEIKICSYVTKYDDDKICSHYPTLNLNKSCLKKEKVDSDFICEEEYLCSNVLLLNEAKNCSNYPVSEKNKLTHNCVSKSDEPTKCEESLKMCEDVIILNQSSVINCSDFPVTNSTIYKCEKNISDVNTFCYQKNKTCGEIIFNINQDIYNDMKSSGNNLCEEFEIADTDNKESKICYFGDYDSNNSQFPCIEIYRCDSVPKNNIGNCNSYPTSNIKKYSCKNDDNESSNFKCKEVLITCSEIEKYPGLNCSEYPVSENNKETHFCTLNANSGCKEEQIMCNEVPKTISDNINCSNYKVSNEYYTCISLENNETYACREENKQIINNNKIIDINTIYSLLNLTVNSTNITNEEIFQKIDTIFLKSYQIGELSIKIQGEGNTLFQITTSDNELKALQGNLTDYSGETIIDLGDCENTLRKQYQINNSLGLIIKKSEELTSTSDRNLKYEIYHPITKEKLNLSYCEDITIDVYIPINITNDILELHEEYISLGYDIFDINDKFYNDICTPFQNKNGTDVLLSDRINDYYNEDNTGCQSGCEYSSYDKNNQFLKCECKVVNEDIDIKNANKFSKGILKAFYDILKNSNYKVLKCYNFVFNSEFFKKNIGSCIVIGLFAIYTSFGIIFTIKGITPLKKDIYKEINDKYNIITEGPKNMGNFPPKRKSHIITKSQVKRNLNKSKTLMNTNHKNIDINITNNIDNLKEINEEKLITTSEGEKERINLKNSDTNKEEIKTIDKINEKEKKGEKEIQNSEQNKKDIIKLDDLDLNNLEYEKAIEFDKRTFIQLYWNKLKNNHIIIYTFFSFNDFNLVHIKIIRFIFIVCTNMTMNIFFFVDSSMHKIYVDYGKYNIIGQIPQIVYSSIVSFIIETLIGFLSSTDNYIYKIRQLKEYKPEILTKMIKSIKIKIIIFFIITFVFLSFYWYWISSFCAVYNNTQGIYFKDFFTSFGLDLAYPFIIQLPITFIRKLILRKKTKIGSLLYKVC